jgi:hypothetical protein
VTVCRACGGPCVWSWRTWRATALEESRALRAELRATLAYDRRWPWEPVEKYLRSVVRPDDKGGQYLEATCTLYGTWLGLHSLTVRKMRADGDLSSGQADMVATRLGLHPLNLWPDFYDPEPSEAAA